MHSKNVRRHYPFFLITYFRNNSATTLDYYTNTVVEILTSVIPSSTRTAMNKPEDALAATGDSRVNMPVKSTLHPTTIRPPNLSAATPPRKFVQKYPQ